MKQPKDQVDYSPGHKDSHCGPVSADDKGYCVNFIKGAPLMRPNYQTMGHCKKVVGLVKRMYWCKLFEKSE